MMNVPDTAFHSSSNSPKRNKYIRREVKVIEDMHSHFGSPWSTLDSPPRHLPSLTTQTTHQWHT
ncbi:hypothetical protein E2C01_044720 [Portunus trituberculatus]|uniref:Uncharacterized protein n=1 Tax=Portunus trituberculatus TaxID=210409 RepID=A0A5B7FZY1_PORTR|nr:hypothetical protein [Portunus trituberculatus]